MSAHGIFRNTFAVLIVCLFWPHTATAQVPLRGHERVFTGTISGPLGERFHPQQSHAQAISLYFRNRIAVYFSWYGVENECASDACSGTTRLRGDFVSVGMRFHPIVWGRVSPWLEVGMQTVKFTLDGSDPYGQSFDLRVPTNGASAAGGAGVDLRLTSWLSISPFVHVSRYSVDGLELQQSSADSRPPEYYYRRIVDPRGVSRGATSGNTYIGGISIDLGISRFRER